MKALSVGLPGREKPSVTPWSQAYKSSALLMNSGPLSRRIVFGVPWIPETRSSVSTTSGPRYCARTSIAGESRLQASTMVRIRILRPLIRDSHPDCCARGAALPGAYCRVAPKAPTMSDCSNMPAASACPVP